MYGTPEPEWLGEPEAGSFNMGGGISTPALANPNVSLEESSKNKGKISGGLLMQSPGVWIVVVVLLIAVKLIAEKAGEKSEFASVRVGLENWFVVGLLAVTFLYVFKTSVALLPGNSNMVKAIKQFGGVI